MRSVQYIQFSSYTSITFLDMPLYNIKHLYTYIPFIGKAEDRKMSILDRWNVSSYNQALLFLSSASQKWSQNIKMSISCRVRILTTPCSYWTLALEVPWSDKGISYSSWPPEAKGEARGRVLPTWFLMYHLAFFPLALNLAVKRTSSTVPCFICLSTGSSIHSTFS